MWGDEVSVKWYPFDVGTYPGNINIKNSTSMQSEFIVPEDVQPGQTIHIIFEVIDSGSPGFTRYQRVIVTVREK
ncbi:MAG: hypothetical protein ACXWCR_13765 [Flavitalea sp.]